MNDRNMNRCELTKSFAYESKCRAYLERLAGPRTPNCCSRKFYRILKRNQFVCNDCWYQFGVKLTRYLNPRLSLFIGYGDGIASRYDETADQ